ncbi:hypothetical protein Q5424_09055 [Conexibacter sp. JD483]|uniref:hypothetical protein n=1 Tax=unclassified Conexibacter TaxID=2627773 RepID=UPI0027232A05|nr:MULTISPECIES: hypothetical protein [unclassified Conexibacter]MDO8184515.1 hypothetical protein [Conexibacter sp. CPCC 205706]MDO8197821.1 hypothetical protein [Conexibacter sp. CPCC 205762]MDR9369227.1 hypothetical protein [Conexibacter sp. JD483]
MVLALAATGIVIFALLGEVVLPRAGRAVANHRARRRRIPQTAEFDLDPGRERRAEARARLLLKSCVNDEEWAMYRDLGFIRVWGMEAGRGKRDASDTAPTGDASDATRAGDAGDTAPIGDASDTAPIGDASDTAPAADALDADAAHADAAADAAERAEARRDDARRQREWERLEGFGERARGRGARRHRLSRRNELREEPYAYLIYPHRPILAYVPQTGRLLNEYCVEFPDETRPYGSPRLPDSDDMLAKWMALTGDERRLIGSANMHLPGRQIDPRQVKRDLWRLRQWERERARAAGPEAPSGRGGGPDGGGPGDGSEPERDRRVPLP